MMTFNGIPLAALDFYEDLEATTPSRSGRHTSTCTTNRCDAPLEALVAELEPKFGRPRLFRPYRDVRFSKDKTPYKTHQGAWFGDTAVYLQVSAAGLFVAGGYWQTSSAQVDRLRRAADDDVVGAGNSPACSLVSGAASSTSTASS